MKYGYPTKGRTDAEIQGIADAVKAALPKCHVVVYPETERLQYRKDDDYFYLRTASLLCDGGSYPVNSALVDYWDRDQDRLAGFFLRVLRALGRGYEAGVAIANHGPDVDRLADLLAKGREAA